MANPDREDIHILSRHSNLPVASIRAALRDFVYSGKDAWQQFLKILFLSLGAGFMLAGLIFFFAYNWDALHKFVKLGIIEALVILLTLTALLMRNNILVRNILLTAASVMIGVLFAVFGQVYQTGADAYDLFLNWTLCTILWVIVAGFAPLWLIWLALVNITVQLYLRQTELSFMTTQLLLFLVNAISLGLTLLLKHFRSQAIPQWFIIVLTLAAASIATIAVSTGIFDQVDRKDPMFFLLLAAVIISYAGIIYYAFRQQSVFFIAVTGFSMIIMLSTGILEVARISTGSVLLVCIFLGAGTTMLIKSLLTLQKQWSHEKAA